MTDARTWLDQVDARTNAATTGPWVDHRDDLTDQVSVHHDQEHVSYVAEVGVYGLPRVQEDAEFIASARTDLPAATTALRAVLDLHRFVRARPGIHSGACSQCWCPYPCPTVAAITTALEDA